MILIIGINWFTHTVAGEVEKEDIINFYFWLLELAIRNLTYKGKNELPIFISWLQSSSQKCVDSFTYVSNSKFSIGFGRLPCGTRKKILGISKSMVFAQAHLWVMRNIYYVPLNFYLSAVLHKIKLVSSIQLYTFRESSSKAIPQNFLTFYL